MDRSGTTAIHPYGPEKPKSFLVLTAETLEDKDLHADLRSLIKQNFIKFEVEGGFAPVPVLEECRAMCDLENFEVMYDLTMQYLTQRKLIVKLIDQDRSERLLGSCFVLDKHFDLRTIECIAEYPVIVNWLTEFVAGWLGKKYPLPTINAEYGEQPKT
jgi:hypothetical protein